MSDYHHPGGREQGNAVVLTIVGLFVLMLFAGGGYVFFARRQAHMHAVERMRRDVEAARAAAEAAQLEAERREQEAIDAFEAAQAEAEAKAKDADSKKIGSTEANEAPVSGAN